MINYHPLLHRCFHQISSILKWAAILFAAALGVLVTYSLAIYFNLPNVNTLVPVTPESETADFQYKDLSENTILAIVAAEDKNFFLHQGIDYRAVARAIGLAVGEAEPVSGASTITMQLAKNALLDDEKTLARKLAQFMLASKIERKMSKEEILQSYLKVIYFGENTYGIKEASQLYFKKTLPDLTLAEAAMLAGIPKAPAKYNPLASPDAALARRDWVLDKMLENEFIDESQFAEALASNF